MSKYELYLNLSIEMINRVVKSLKGIKYDKFVSDFLLLDATNMRIQIISENIFNLSNKYLNKIKSVNLSDLKITRNIVSHSYSNVNPKLVWYAITKNLPSLKKELLEIKKELKNVK